MPNMRCSAESGEIFGDSDVYGIANLDQAVATILLRGAVTESLDPASKNLEGPKNNPMMPLAWLREYTAPNGTTKGKAFCTTMGSSTDFADEDLRRLVVNAAFHLTGQKVPAKADVNYVDPFSPTFYSAIGAKGLLQEPQSQAGRLRAWQEPGHRASRAEAGCRRPGQLKKKL